jgi:hypothetical protein
MLRPVQTAAQYRAKRSRTLQITANMTIQRVTEISTLILTGNNSSRVTTFLFFFRKRSR